MVYFTNIFLTLNRKERYCFEKFVMTITDKEQLHLKTTKPQNKQTKQTHTKLLLLWSTYSADQSLSKAFFTPGCFN